MQPSHRDTLELAAGRGDPYAQEALAYALDTGAWGKRDTKEAVQWYRRAAAQGQVVAMYNLGQIFAEGAQSGRGMRKAIHWWRKAAELGHARALANLGVAHEEGRGVRRSAREARRFYYLAARSGDFLGHFNLGRMHWLGIGGRSNITQGQRHFRLALPTIRRLARNDRQAAYCLGKCAYHGWGLKTNLGVAIRLFRRAASKGVPEAMRSLAVSYQDGDGVHKSPRLAAHWVQKAERVEASYPLGNKAWLGIVDEG
jgi:hypothetical protein